MTSERVHQVEVELLAALLHERRTEIYQLLRTVATARAASHEIDIALKTLAGVSRGRGAADPQPERCGQLAVYLPGNMVLYSTVLYGVVPAPLCGEIVLRPGADTALLAANLWDLLSPALPEHLRLYSGSRRSFYRLACGADGLVFCGRLESVSWIRSGMKDGAVLIYLGSGINPFVVTASASLPEALAAAAADRSFNGGRDCLCPDLFLVEERVADEFVDGLRQAVESLPCGDLENEGVEVCCNTNAAALDRCAAFLDEHRKHVVLGGRCQTDRGVLEPTVVVRRSGDPAAPEFFAPLWNVVIYDSSAEIDRVLRRGDVLRRACGLTLFGEYDHPVDPGYGLVSRARGLFEVEDGNSPFGGYRSEASFVLHRGVVYEHPVLVGREIARYALNARRDGRPR